MITTPLRRSATHVAQLLITCSQLRPATGRASVQRRALLMDAAAPHHPGTHSTPPHACPSKSLKEIITCTRGTSAPRFGPFQLQPPRRRRVARPLAPPLPSRVTLAGGSRFATLIPGDGALEQVVTSGLSSFL